MKGFFVNCKKYPFVEQIFLLDKLVETRTANTLGKICDEKRVAIIETGHGKPMVRGYCRLVNLGSHPATGAQGSFLRKVACIAGTDYDIPEGGKKWHYAIKGLEKCEPYELPAHVNHGRAWTEF